MADSRVLVDLPDGVYEDVQGWSGMIRHPDIMALTAGAYPVKPPSKWFSNPVLSGLTPLTIDDDGRVFGHIAAWHTSHIGMAGGVKPPRSKTDYAYYQTGVVKCDDSKLINVGQITLTGGHAPLNAGVARAVAHYDDTASAIMDEAAGEDNHGIWVAGALRPDVTEAQLRSIRASSVSGDWRPINGKLELVAVCAVNAPGFPIPRARIASGAPIALVAAGIEPLIEIAMNDRIESHVEEGIQAGLELFRERILRLENVVLADGGLIQGDNPDMTTEEAVDTDWDRTIKLRKRVRGSSPLAASLRERVHITISEDVAQDVQSLAASLRARVKGADAGPKAPAPEALTAARGAFNPLLHPRDANGRFIEVGSWVRWLRQGFGSARRGEVIGIIPDPKKKSRDGVPGGVIARVEFPDRDGQTITYDVPFDELEKVAPPKGAVSGPDVPDLPDVSKADDGGHVGSDNHIAEKIAAKAIGAIVHPDLPHLPSPLHSVPGINEPNLKDRKPNAPYIPDGAEDGNDTMNQLDPSQQDAVKKTIENAVVEVVNESLPDTSAEQADPTDDQLQAEEIANLDESGDGEGIADSGLIETPYVPPSDEWEKTSEWFKELQGEDTPISEAIVDELRPDAFKETSEWADAVRLARARYEGWRTSQLAENPDAEVSLDDYLDWLESRGLKAALVAGLRADSRVRGDAAILARATEYWTKEKRQEAAEAGVALEDGSYPIEDVEDLRKAIQSYGRAPDPHTTKRHIIKRANLLASLGLLPDGWVGRGFDPAKHMRGPDGKFLRTSSAASDPQSEADRLRGRIHGTR